MLKLVMDVPDSNHDWKGRYFFVQGVDKVCRLEEWVNVVEFDNTWGVLDMSGELFAAKLVVCGDSSVISFFFFFF